MISTRALLVIAVLCGTAGTASAQTCADQNDACLKRKHTAAECAKSTNSCLKTGKWIGPAGREYPISSKK